MIPPFSHMGRCMVYSYVFVFGNWFISKATTIPIVVSIIRSIAKARGLSSFPCVAVIQRKTTHIRNVPFSCFINTEKLIIGISKNEKNKYLSKSLGMRYIFFSKDKITIPKIPPITVAISRVKAALRLSFKLCCMHNIAAIAA